jgi:multimeric flavodoxin WrbA
MYAVGKQGLGTLPGSQILQCRSQGKCLQEDGGCYTDKMETIIELVRTCEIVVATSVICE